MLKWFYMFIANYDSCGDHGFTLQPNQHPKGSNTLEYYEALFENVWNTLKPKYYERYE